MHLPEDLEEDAGQGREHDEGYAPIRVPFLAEVATLELEQLSLREEEAKVAAEGNPEEMELFHQWLSAAQDYSWPKEGDPRETLDPPPMLFVQLPTHFPTTINKLPPLPAAANQDKPDVMLLDEDGRVESKMGSMKPVQPTNEAHQKHVASLAKLFQANHSIKGLPSGHIGQLVFMKSGKVKLHLGPISSVSSRCSSSSSSTPSSPPSSTPVQPSSLCLDLRPSTPCLFEQELVSVSPETGQACHLGPIRNRLVSSLDIHSVE